MTQNPHVKPGHKQDHNLATTKMKEPSTDSSAVAPTVVQEPLQTQLAPAPTPVENDPIY